MNLGLVDWLFVVLYVAGVFAAGFVVKKYVKGIDAYLVAGRSMGFHLGLLSLMCTEIGMITYMYFAELGYNAGFSALIVGLAPFCVFLFIGKTGFILKPLLEMKIKTLPEFFARKFGRGVRFYAGLLMAVGGVLNFGVFPGVEARFINIVTGISEEYLLLTMTVLLTVVLIYTLLGGMVSVIVTNYIQYVLLSLSMIAITAFGIFKIGFPDIIESVRAGLGPKGLNPFTPSFLKGEFGLGFIVWQILLWTAVLTSWQVVAMRIFSAKDSATGRRIFTWSSLMFLSRAILPIFWGAVALAYLGRVDDPLTALPAMLVAITPRGLLGILLGSLLAASMSTYASYLLSWSSVISQDLIGSAARFLTGREFSSKTQLAISRVCMAALMMFLIWWSLFHRIEGYLYFYLNMTIMLFVPGTLVSVALGLYWKRARAGGAFAAFTLGALPPLLYFLPGSPDASLLGWGSFLLALTGMIVGSLVHGVLRPVVKEVSP
jgi:solute:Na+ symporter, SSS family